MVMSSYTDIRDRIGKDLADLASPESQARLIDRLADLCFEIDRIKTEQRVLMTALRARDVIVREQCISAGAPRVIALDPRDNLDMTEGFHKLEWDKDVAVRWTGPGHETLIRLWLDRTIPVIFELSLLSFGDPRNRGAVTLTVDGLPVALEQADETLLRSAPLPPLDQSLYTEFVIYVPFLTGGADASTGAPEEASTGRTRSRAKKVLQAPVDVGERRGVGVSYIRLLSAA